MERQSATAEDLIKNQENSTADEILTGCLKGEEFSEEASPVYRLFEEILAKTSVQNSTALIYTGLILLLF